MRDDARRCHAVAHQARRKRHLDLGGRLPRQPASPSTVVVTVTSKPTCLGTAASEGSGHGHHATGMLLTPVTMWLADHVADRRIEAAPAERRQINSIQACVEA